VKERKTNKLLIPQGKHLHIMRKKPLSRCNGGSGSPGRQGASSLMTMSFPDHTSEATSSNEAPLNHLRSGKEELPFTEIKKEPINNDRDLLKEVHTAISKGKLEEAKSLISYLITQFAASPGCDELIYVLAFIRVLQKCPANEVDGLLSKCVTTSVKSRLYLLIAIINLNEKPESFLTDVNDRFS